MATTLITLLLLACLLLWILAWERRRQLAIGVAIGAVLVLVGTPIVRAIGGMNELPVWVPALPFAFVALSLFGFGVLAWFWGED